MILNRYNGSADLILKLRRQSADNYYKNVSPPFKGSGFGGFKFSGSDR